MKTGFGEVAGQTLWLMKSCGAIDRKPKAYTPERRRGCSTRVVNVEVKALKA